MATNKHDRIEKLLEVLGSGLYEKETAVKLGLLTALAGESMFMLGAPGCAKSMITRRIKEAFKAYDKDGVRYCEPFTSPEEAFEADDKDGVKYFETLLNQFTTPEEVFGNISLKALNGEFCDVVSGIKKEEYRRLTEGMLPEADIAFLDEIWKASPAILNTLLTIVNERKFHNGSEVMNVPLKALFAASNELPAKGKGLEALYDRFIFRLPVDFIKNEDDFFEMIDQPAHEEFKLNDEDKKLLISNKELKEWAGEIDKVKLSEVSKDVISAIRKEMQVQNEKMSEEDKTNGEMFEIGDRRWKKIAHILKTSAFINDREEVDLMDCSLIENCIWGTEKQQKKAREIVEKCLKENGISCDSAIEDIEDEIEEFDSKITEEWFEKKEKPEKDKIVNVDGIKCYQCSRTDTNETCYVSVNARTAFFMNNYHIIYDSNKKYVRENSFSKNGDNISCYWKFKVNKVAAKKYYEEKKLSDIAYETKQKNFDKDNYLPIVDSINSEIKVLTEQKDKDAISFKANLFADQSYKDTLFSKIDEAIRQLEDAKIDLDKKRTRYYKSELNAKLSPATQISKWHI